jgi:hypothetical protein
MWDWTLSALTKDAGGLTCSLKYQLSDGTSTRDLLVMNLQVTENPTDLKDLCVRIMSAAADSANKTEAIQSGIDGVLQAVMDDIQTNAIAIKSVLLEKKVQLDAAANVNLG